MQRRSFLRNTGLTLAGLALLNKDTLAAFLDDPAWDIKMLTKDIGIFTEKGCGGINVISSETGSFPPSSILRRHEYSTQSFARGTTPKIVSFASNSTLCRGIFKGFPCAVCFAFGS